MLLAMGMALIDSFLSLFYWMMFRRLVSILCSEGLAVSEGTKLAEVQSKK